MIGYTHSPYPARILGAPERLGAARAVAVRGIEGSDMARPGRPTAIAADGPLDLAEEPRAGAERGRVALRDGSAAGALDALVGA